MGEDALKTFIECYRGYNIYFSSVDSISAYLVEVNAHWESETSKVYIGNLPFGSLEEAKTWLDENISVLPSRTCQNGEQAETLGVWIVIVFVFLIWLIVELGRRRLWK